MFKMPPDILLQSLLKELRYLDERDVAAIMVDLGDVEREWVFATLGVGAPSLEERNNVSLWLATMIRDVSTKHMPTKHALTKLRQIAEPLIASGVIMMPVDQSRSLFDHCIAWLRPAPVSRQ
jgi:hypothetical protein